MVHISFWFFPECVTENCAPDCDRKFTFSKTANVETTVNNWLQQRAVDFFETGIQKLVTRRDTNASILLMTT
jgi:hypothetical protein